MADISLGPTTSKLHFYLQPVTADICLPIIAYFQETAITVPLIVPLR